MSKTKETEATKRPSGRPSYDIQVRAINGTLNPRNPLSASLVSQGWDCMKGDKDIWKLATSDDATERAMFVQLIQDFDQHILTIAATVLSQGLHNPIDAVEGGSAKYRLISGHCRSLAVLFNWCLLGKPKEPFIQAFLQKGNTSSLTHRAVVNNLHRPQSVIDEAKAIQMTLNAGETKDEVARQLGCSLKTINERLKLLELEPREQQKIHEGKKTVTQAKAERNGSAKAEGDKPPPIRKRKEIEAALEELGKGEARNAIEWVLGLREKIS